MIKLFIFDMGGVVARDFDVLPGAAALLGLSEQSLLDFIREDVEGLMNGSIPSIEFWNRFSERSGIKVEKNLLLDLFNPSLDEDTIKLILDIKSYCPAVCGTNTIAEHYIYHRDRGDYAVFDRVYASHIMGVAKPRAEFFHRILDQESVLPEEAIFCDDMIENIESAAALGIHSFLFSNAETFKIEFAGSGLSIHSS